MASNSLVWYFIGLIVSSSLFFYLAWQLGKLSNLKTPFNPDTQINETSIKAVTITYKSITNETSPAEQRQAML